MKVFHNHNLRPYNFLRINAIAQTFFVPENQAELVSLLQQHNQRLIISGGTNILLNDTRPLKTPVIYLGQFNTAITFDVDNRIFVVGASARIQTSIDFINAKGYGGLEFLYHLPGALMGGVVVMNAGLGRTSNKQVSDFVVSAKVFDGNTIRVLKREDIRYDYRDSIMHRKQWVVTEVVLSCPAQDKEYSAILKRQRIEQARQFDNSAPNVGSVFKRMHFNTLHLSIIKIGGARFSDRTPNWFLNTDNKSTFIHFMILINIARLCNFVFKFRLAELEIDILHD